METRNWYIYETKNLINGKTYIGQRKCPTNKTPETDTDYMGSGFMLTGTRNKSSTGAFQKFSEKLKGHSYSPETKRKIGKNQKSNII
jgi:hypothetical protein